MEKIPGRQGIIGGGALRDFTVGATLAAAPPLPPSFPPWPLPWRLQSESGERGAVPRATNSLLPHNASGSEKAALKCQGWIQFASERASGGRRRMLRGQAAAAASRRD